MDSVYIYGTGSGARKYFNHQQQFLVLGFIDSNATANSTTFCNLPVLAPTQLTELAFDYIILANEYAATFYTLRDLSIPLEKIKFIYYKGLMEVVSKESQYYFEQYHNPEQPLAAYYSLAMSYQHAANLESLYSSEFDYVRFKLLELLAEQIQKQNINGNLAEVGVFRGTFARVINSLFADRTLYLFDTFAGFNPTERETDIQQGYAEPAFFTRSNNFADTSVELVMQRMPHPTRCIPKVGYFPDSLEGLEDQFALVSIDVDLYTPMLNAIEYFYPRLAAGGYLMLHDYNHAEFRGVKQAVADYEAKHGKLAKVPVPDQGGSIIITKLG
ncbi:TylF/MycF/NovP-related O-methyltransferase [Aliidiomarina celeris]|uniref:TylF/MycF/NovP-related O-methyltransferase n=1 Tax=Aliidiomarina celeris TaxID=2249428 RepID=UPI000DEAF1B1|nr:TylF/MycF/NovP-related O-methyltransferase [Aliidiomarina celeris]